MFNPNPKITRVPLGESCVCVVDDVLQAPAAWVAEAANRNGEFVDAPYNAYPGLELRLPDALSARFGAVA